MKVFKEDFDWAASRGLITPEQADALWEALSDKVSDRPQFNFANGLSRKSGDNFS